MPSLTLPSSILFRSIRIFLQCQTVLGTTVIVHYELDRDSQYRHHKCVSKDTTWFQIELIHEQLPLPVPCYDLLPVNELTVVPHT